MKERFQLSRLDFPSSCARCGAENAPRKTRLILPYRAWWRSNPIVKSPVCTRCFLALWLEEQVSSILVLGAAIAGKLYLSPWIALRVVALLVKLFPTMPNWLTVHAIVNASLFAYLLLFGHIRDCFLRRGRLKVEITDYRNHWAEIECDDAAYYLELSKHSEVYSDQPVLAFQASPSTLGKQQR